MFLKNMLSDKLFWKSTLLMALPIAFQNLISSSFSFVDLLMIGSLGDDTIAAIGLAGQISFLQNIFLFGICSGGMVFISQYWGAGNISGIKRTYGIIMTNCITVGLLFFTLSFFAPRMCMSFYTDDKAVIEIGAKYLKYVSFSYLGSSFIMGFSYVLRATERVWIPLFTNIFAVITNVFLNYVFIFGKLGFPQMGVKGAAIATVAAAFLNPILILLFSYFKKSILISPIKEIFSFNWISLKGYYLIALPVFLNEMFWALGMTMYNAIYGRMENYAALTISKTVESLVFVLFIGLCNACAVLIGKYIGLNKIYEAKEYAKRFIILVPFLGLVAGGLVILLRGNILSFFSTSEAVHNLAYSLLLVFGLQVGLRNIPYICIVGIFRAGGDTKTGMYYDLICLWLIGLPITFLCGVIFKLDFILVYILMLFSEDIVKAFLCIRFFVKMKWIKPVERRNE
ncbi:MAG TPA: MATE family efflux transporter [Clostridiales bacterium]|nr:MAG: hypothetical protein A2Y40_06320 [Candidatus Margulisbacteria bacterium GWF2_35_9]HAN20708.1 MATE family efflux transporter [Clostridiales bacterium]